MSMAGLTGCAAQRVGAAKRRRDRQPRALRRHELLTVRMELAAALHHSVQPSGPVVEGPREEEVLARAPGLLFRWCRRCRC